MSGLFPFIDGTISDDVIENESVNLPIFKEISWDFGKNEFEIIKGNLKIVEGKEALKIWIYKVLNTKRYKHIIYTWNYGCELENLIGRNNYRELIKKEIQRYIKEALLVNKYISDVSSTAINSDGDKLDIDIIAKTVYGDVEVSLLV